MLPDLVSEALERLGAERQRVEKQFFRADLIADRGILARRLVRLGGGKRVEFLAVACAITLNPLNRQHRSPS